MTAPSTADAAKLSAILKKIQDDLAKLKGGASTNQLQNTSIEASEGRGFIPILQNGEVKHVIGRQPDGTFASISVNNRNPPAVPNRPVCTPTLSGVQVYCDGFGTAQFADFSHINVYVDAVCVSTLLKVPESTVIAPLDYQPHKFRLTAVNLSGTESGPTEDVVCTPAQVVTDDMSEEIIANLGVKDGEVTAAKLAVGAITSIAIANQAIETVNIDNAAITSALIAANAIQSTHIQDGAITGPDIAANAVQTNNIASGAITATQIAANAITTLALSSGSVTAAAIAAGAITAGAIQSSAITADKLAANSVTAAVIAAGTITATQLAANSVTTLQLAANSVTASAIAAGAIQAGAIAAGSISTDKLAAGAITTDKLAANSVTALQIATNSITAAMLQAGSITADKLAAQVILASSQIIAGSLTGTRVVIDQTGLTQVDAKGNIAFQLGTTAKGNSLTVIDPSDPNNALASIAADGSMTMSGISINGQATLNGIDLVQFLNNLPQGCIARGQIGKSPSVSGTGTAGWFEFSFDAIAGRVYRISTDNICIYSIGSSGTTVMQACRVKVTYTTDGSVPTISGGTGTLLTDVSVTRFNSTNPYGSIGTPPLIDSLIAPTTSKIRCLVWLDGANADGGTNDSGILSGTGVGYNLNYIVEDLGVQPAGAIGGSSNGAGSTSAVQQHVNVYNATYTAYYGDSGPTGPTTGLEEGMAGSVNYMSMIGFPYSTIASNCTGAAIDKVELFLYSNYWALSAGGVACVGAHNVAGSTAPSTYSQAYRDILDQAMKKPQGLWLQLPTTVISNIISGNIKGLTLDSRVSNPGATNFGTFYDTTYIDSSLRPQLRVTYRK